MKLLLVSPSPIPGGPVGGMGSVTVNMLGYLKNNAKDIDLRVYNNVHKLRSLMTRSLIIRLFTGMANSMTTYLKVLQLIRKFRPDIIHLASSASFALIRDYLIVKAAKQSGIPIVLHWHFGRVPSLLVKRNWEWRLFRRVIRMCTRSIVIDKNTQDSLMHEGFSNIVYIPNPLAIDTEKTAREYSLKPNQRKPNRLIFAGHVIRDKGVYELVEACSRIPAVSEVILIGSYKENVRIELMQIAGKRDEGNWLNFVGQQTREQVLEYMFSSPALVLPSYTEGFPMVILEAMAMGCAIIATDVGAVSEMIACNSDKPCGICVPPMDIDKLAVAISTLTENPQMTGVMGKRGTERVLSNFVSDRVGAQYVEVWKTTVSEHRQIGGSRMTG